MNHLKCTLLVFSAVLLTACGKNENIVGKWMQAVPGLPELKQGFVLEADGKASSVNMATLSYKAWQQELILRYAKEDTISQKKLNENIPASLIAPAKKH